MLQYTLLYDPKKENLFSTTSKSNYKLRETILFSVMMSGMGYTLEIILSVSSERDDGIQVHMFCNTIRKHFHCIRTSINAWKNVNYLWLNGVLGIEYCDFSVCVYSLRTTVTKKWFQWQ